MKFTLFPYQRQFCRSVVDAFENGVDGQRFNRILGIAATGAGKTIMASALIWYWAKKKEERCLFLADTDELCAQTVDKIYRSTGLIPDLEKAESRASTLSNVVVASIQTISRRLERWRPDHFGAIIADEAHLSMAESWQRTLLHFQGKQLGITATPERADKRSLMKFWQHVAADIPLKQLINERRLSPLTVETMPLQIPVRSKITDGDSEALAAELRAYHEAIIDAVEATAGDRKKILWFHPSVPSSREFTSLLMQRGHSAAHVDGESADRAQIIEGFARGRFRHLNNCSLLTKGYDCPDVDAVVILRLTKSRTAYIQMAGRGTRLHCPHGCTEWCDHPERKQDCLLIDFLWQCEDHDIMGPADLLTDDPVTREEVRKSLREKKGDLLEVEQAVFGQREQQMIDRLRRQDGKRRKKVDAREFAAINHQPELLNYVEVAPWEMQEATPRQKENLAKSGISTAGLSRGMASALITALKSRRERGRATIKQVLSLYSAGIEGAENLTFEAASAALDHHYEQR